MNMRDLGLTKHFNGLTEAEAERLAILAEECGGVIQAIGKILRHGYASKGEGPHDNREELAYEVGHMLFAARVLGETGDVDKKFVEASAKLKAEAIKDQLHHNLPESKLFRNPAGS